MKEFKVFFASSITEFAYERSYIGDHVRRINDSLDMNGCWLKREMCEDESNAVSLKGKQNEYNDLIRDCDLFIMIVGKKVGEYTAQEYDVALERYRSNGEPEICVFFKDDIDESEMQESLLKFRNRITEDTGINVLSFASVDDICSVLDGKTSEFFQLDNCTESSNTRTPVRDMKEVNIVIDIDRNELDHERYELGSYIDTLNDQFRHNGIYYRLFFRDDIGLSDISVNDRLDSSDLFYLIFSRTTKEQMEKDFDIALAQFRKTDKAPKIYTYFQSLSSNETASESVRRFMDRLDKEVGHYYSFFDHIDSVKLNMVLELAKSQSLRDRVTVTNGEVLLDGNGVLSLENVPIYKMNEELQNRKDSLRQMKARCQELALMIVADPDDTAVFNELAEINKKIKETEDSLHDMEMTILDMFSRIADYNSSGKPISERQKLASIYLDKGDYKNALAALDLNEIRRDVARLNERKEKGRAEYALHVREYSDRINILRSQGVTLVNLPEIFECYEEASAIAIENKVELDIVYSYATFLYGQHDFDKSIRYARILEAAYVEIDEEDDFKLAALFNLTGLINIGTRKFDKAEKYYLKALEIREKLAKCNPSVFVPELARSYNNIAGLYQITNRLKQAEEYYLKAIEVQERLVRSNPSVFEPDLAKSYGNIAMLYSSTGHPKQAEEYHLKALEIMKRLARSNPSVFEPDLAHIYNNIAVFYSSTVHPKQAEEYHLKALEIMKRLARSNPSAYELELASSYSNIATLYSKTNRTEQAEAFYLKALKIMERLAKSNSSAYEYDLANSYSNIATLYSKTNRTEQAEAFYLKALKIMEKLTQSSPSAFEPYLALSYNNVASLYADTNRSKRAEEYFLKAIELRESLAKSNPSAFEYDLATSYYNNAELYLDTNRYKQAEEYYLKAIEVLKRLVNVDPFDPSVYEPKLATIYDRIAMLYSDTKRFEEADEYHLKAIEIREKPDKTNPSEYDFKMAMSYDMIAKSYSDTKRLNAAERYRLEALQFWERLAKIDPSAFEPILAMSYDNLASLVSRHNQVIARAFYNQAYRLYNKHNNVEKAARCLHCIAVEYSKEGKWKSAERYYREAYEKGRDLFGDDNEDTIISLNYLAYDLKELGKYEESLEKFQIVYKWAREHLGDRNENTMNTKKYIEDLQAKLNKQ